MSEENDNIEQEGLLNDETNDALVSSDEIKKAEGVVHLSGMYKDWFLDYASYVILERAVPHLHDGLKPVQRRILHSMKRLDDGRYNKVANIIGHTMQFHPHGDASIGDALVQIGQKELLVDTQGNWGNILTGDSSAAPRYIEARLSKFAIDVVFNPKTTVWTKSYDGRNNEPVTLPVKFPLLLVQGVEGIAVGLASKILPHNFIEIIDAAIKYLKKQSFELFPDFITGGLADFSKYNEGIRGGQVKVRARINKVDNRTLTITELPFGKTTTSLIDTIVKANEKGKIKIKKIDDNTAEKVEILIQLGPNVSSDKTIDALYAFTDCEISISPNSCVIENNKPRFIGVSEMLKISVDNTLSLLKQELEIRLNELEEAWHYSSLEKIFILNEIYEDIKECKTEESIILAIDKGLKPFIKNLKKEVRKEDIEKLSNLPIKRISKYSSFKADEHIKVLEAEMDEVKNHLENIVDYTINYFKQIRKKHGEGRERRTEIRSFDTIIAAKVVVANEKLYVNRKEGFVGTSLKKDEFVCECSDIDDIISIKADGSYVVTKISDKSFVGKDILYVNVFKKNDNRTVYNLVYRDGMNGAIMMKRCAVTGITRDKEYFLSKGTPNSKILYLTVNTNGEAEIIKVFLVPRPRLRNTVIEIDFSEQAIKGKGSMGNILTKYGIRKIVLKEKGKSTLGGRKIWFDWDVLRLNVDKRGDFLGEFFSNDKLIAINKDGTYRITSFDLTNHFEEDLFILEKFSAKKIWSAIYFEGEQKFFYLKRFVFENTNNVTCFISETKDSKLSILSKERFPQFEVKFGGKHASRENEKIDADEFIAVKGLKAKGKRLSTYTISKIIEIEPLEKEISDDDFPDDNPIELIDGELIEKTKTKAEDLEIENDFKDEIIDEEISINKPKKSDRIVKNPKKQEKLIKQENLIKDKKTKNSDKTDTNKKSSDSGQMSLEW